VSVLDFDRPSTGNDRDRWGEDLDKVESDEKSSNVSWDGETVSVSVTASLMLVLFNDRCVAARN